MLTPSELRKEIQKLESEESSWTVVQRLSWLYTLRNNTSSNEMTIDGSEFLSVASTKNIDRVMSVMNELMDTVKAVYPKIYNAVMKKLNEI